MPLYEHIFIARQDVSATQVDSLSDAMTEVIKAGGGEVKKKEYWGLKNLTYRIKKNRKGHYVLMNLDAPVDAVKEMERQLRLHEDVLRYLTLRVGELEEGPSAVMQGRGAREERGGRGGRGGRREGGGHRRDAEVQDAKPGETEEKAKAAETEKKAEAAETEKKAEAAEGEKKAEAAEGEKKAEAAEAEKKPEAAEAEEAEKPEKTAGAKSEPDEENEGGGR